MRSTDYTEASLDDLLWHGTVIDAAPRRPFGRRLAVWAGSIALTAGAIATLSVPAGWALSETAGAAIEYWDELPSELPLDTALPQHTVLLDKDGAEYARFYSENRIDVGLDAISENFTTALIATEDARFYEHGGIDAKGIVRAFTANFLNGNRQGASTITQQLVQNILISNARDEAETSVAYGTTYNAKLRELRYATALEDQLTKDEILNMYANTVYFGNGAYGVQAAAITYFNKPASELNVPESALLIGLLKGPAVYDPLTKPEAAENRRNTVLSRMLATGALTEEEFTAAAAAPLGISPGTIPSGCDNSDYPFYCSLVRSEILNDEAFGDTREAREDRLTRGGMVLTTGLDRKAMAAAQTSVNEAMSNSNRAALGVAVVVPGTGAVAAIAQNRDWGTGEGQTEIIYADSQAQPGSAMKPITLATALEQGIPASEKLNSVSPYVSRTLANADGGFINYGNVDYGWIDARGAIKVSSNTYFIQLIERTGVIPVADMAARLGITTFPREGDRAITGTEASLTLGAREVTPLELAGAYATFAAEGVNCRPVAITSGKRADTGEPVTVTNPDCHQAVSPAVANTVADSLRQPFTEGGTLAEMKGLTGRESGAKTGTTNDFSANWIAGITPQYASAVWLGDPRGGNAYPLDYVEAYGRGFTNLTGSEIAAPVWKATMDRIHAGLPARPMPKADDAGTAVSTARQIPDVRGMGTAEAMTLLSSYGIRATVAEETAGEHYLPRDTVASQTPGPGSTLGYKQDVTLTLTRGSETLITAPEAK